MIKAMVVGETAAATASDPPLVCSATVVVGGGVVEDVVVVSSYPPPKSMGRSASVLLIKKCKQISRRYQMYQQVMNRNLTQNYNYGYSDFL